MSKLKDIKQTKEAKEEYVHPIIDILLERATKEDLTEILHCSEREVRNIIAECAMHYAIIVYSNGKGYRRAKNIDTLNDLELRIEYDEVSHSARELNSRIKCLKKRLKPLIAWKKVAEKRLKLLKEKANETNK